MQGLMKGKRGLIMGVANNHSLAWGIAKHLADQGAELAFTYQGDALGKRVKPLAEQVGSDFVLPCDVEDIATVDAVFDEIEKKWGKLDFIVHAIGFSDKTELKGRYADVTTRENFSRTMVISAYSFTEVAQRAERLMKDGGSILTLTYGGSTRTIPNYNVMGVAKAALEAMVRYLAAWPVPVSVMPVRSSRISAVIRRCAALWILMMWVNPPSICCRICRAV
jgi:enoyl-[acyl-carrier protein] reductase I